MLTTESEKRLRNEEQLSGLQRKKGAIIFGAMPKDLKTGTPVTYKVVASVEEREVDDYVEILNEDGVTERVKTKKVIKLEKNSWAFGVVSGMQPAVDSRGLHGNGYEVTTSDGSTVTVPRDSIITREMHDHIKYRPTILMLYLNDEPVMVVLYTWDSLYLPCPLLKQYVPSLLEESMIEFIDNQKGYDVDGGNLTVSVVDANKQVHTFGPMGCTLFLNSDCRGCLSRMLNFYEGGWDGTRNLAKQLCGRGTMYAEGNFPIKRGVRRELFIRFIEIERWAAIRGGKYLLYLVEELNNFNEVYGVGVPRYQLEAVEKIIKEKTAEEYAAIKKNGTKDEVAEYKELKKQLNAALKKVSASDETADEGEIEATSED